MAGLVATSSVSVPTSERLPVLGRMFWGVEVTTRRVRRGVEHLGGLAGVWPGRGVAGVGSGGSDGFLRWMCEELTSLFTCSFHSERLWGCPFPFMVCEFLLLAQERVLY